MKRGILILVAIIAALKMFAADIIVDGLYYNVISLTEFEVALTQPDRDVQYPSMVVIPGFIEYNGKQLKVCAISGAFKNQSNVESVFIPKEVREIFSESFNKCTALKELIIEDSPTPLKMGYNKFESSPGYDGPGKGLFYDCKLEKLYIGRCIEYDQSYYGYYGYAPFYNQQELSNVELGDNVNILGMYFFYNAKKLKNIVIPNGFERFESYSFESSGIENINFPASVTYIGASSFRGTSLSEVNIPDLVNKIDIYTFANCNNLSTIRIGKGIKEICNFAFESENIVSVYSYSTQPPKFSTYNQLPFGSFTTKTCIYGTLYVPKESLSLYKNSDGWNSFWNICDLESAGIDTIEVDWSAPIYYNINGVEIKNPQQGIFIRQQGSRLDKIVIP